jgi:hypothetical protein
MAKAKTKKDRAPVRSSDAQSVQNFFERKALSDGGTAKRYSDWLYELARWASRDTTAEDAGSVEPVAAPRLPD